jgi:hypothetical protein
MYTHIFEKYVSLIPQISTNCPLFHRAIHWGRAGKESSHINMSHLKINLFTKHLLINSSQLHSVLGIVFSTLWTDKAWCGDCKWVSMGSIDNKIQIPGSLLLKYLKSQNPLRVWSCATSSPLKKAKNTWFTTVCLKFTRTHDSLMCICATQLDEQYSVAFNHDTKCS